MRHTKKIMVVLVILLVCCVQVSIFLGQFSISFDQYHNFLLALWAQPSSLSPETFTSIYNVIFEIRLPRIIAAVMIGSSLAIAGSTFQAMFINPLVSPGILGVLAGASFGAALGMVLNETWFGIQCLAFLFGFGAVALAIGIAYIYHGSKNRIVLVLGGVISSALFTSLLSVLKYTADPQSTLPAIVYWLMGSLALSSKESIYALLFPMLLSMAMLVGLSKYLNVLSLGDEAAKALGINVLLLKSLTIFFATLISALCVVLAGVIGWVGLIIPHITRLIFGADNQIVLPASALIGAIFLVIADNASRLWMSYEIPIGILTSLVGIPIFIIVLRSAKEAIW
ncbi:MAG: iron ABC transporter permease [Sulfurospirillaceae bacterium]|nr:iron ABC transporter permease [Sulfurospirillaceae bacterium]